MFGKVISAILAFLAFAIFANIYGIVMCFKASVVLGVGTIFAEGSGFLEAMVWWIGGYNIAEHEARALNLH